MKVVFVDEVQNLRPGSDASELMEDLHIQGKIPVLLVCAGLSTSSARLADAGISRVSASRHIRLGRLPTHEALGCAERTLALSRQWGVHVPDGEMKAWAVTIAEPSHHWPRHLYCYLQAVWGVGVCGSGPASLATASLGEALEQCRELLEDYYLERRRNSGVPLEVAGTLHMHLADGRVLKLGEAIDLTGEAIDERLSASSRARARDAFPSDSDCVDAMPKSGLVSLDEHEFCVSPVPPMTDFIPDRCEGREIQLDRQGESPAP